MWFEDFLREYDEVITKFDSTNRRERRPLKSAKLNKWQAIVCVFIGIIVMVIWYSHKVITNAPDEMGRSGVMSLVMMAVILMLLILDGRLWFGTSKQIKADRRRTKKQLQVIYDLLDDHGIKSRSQIERLCSKTRNYKPRLFKMILEYKNLLIIILLQIGIPLYVFVLTYIAGQENYKSDIRSVVVFIVESMLIIMMLLCILMIIWPLGKDIFINKSVIAEYLLNDLELLLILFPLDQQIKELPEGKKGNNKKRKKKNNESHSSKRQTIRLKLSIRKNKYSK